MPAPFGSAHVGHRPSRALAVLALLLLSSACAVVSGGIPPSQFHFTKVVRFTGSGSGGWKVAQVAIMLGRLSPAFPRATICQVEVQVPEVNYRGPVPDELAQTLSAAAADAAARIVLKEDITLSAALCVRFRQEMERILSGDEAIPGARVTAFMTSGVPRTSFP